MAVVLISEFNPHSPSVANESPFAMLKMVGLIPTASSIFVLGFLMLV
jgi:hypothetical protein